MLICKANLKISDIPEDKIFTSEKTGKKYLPITIIINDDLNDFGKQGPIFVEQSKEERLEKQPKEYLGDVEVVYVEPGAILTTKDLKNE